MKMILAKDLMVLMVLAGKSFMPERCTDPTISL